MDHAKAYIGATRKDTTAREGARRRKFKQGDKGNCEPAIKWWKAAGSFWRFCPIVVLSEDSATQLFMKELMAIHVRQPELNSPAVWELLPDKRKHVAFKPSQVVNPSSIHALTSWVNYIPKIWSDTASHRLWFIVAELAQKGFNTKPIFQKLLSPRETSADEIYLLFKVADKMDNPQRCFVRGKLKRVMHLRNLWVPTPERPLKTPFLAHDHYKAELRRLIIGMTSRCKSGALPYTNHFGKLIEARAGERSRTRYSTSKQSPRIWISIAFLSAPAGSHECQNTR